MSAPRLDFCKRGHDLREEGARSARGECLQCAAIRQSAYDARARERAAVRAHCPRCGADMRDPANVCYRRGSFIKMCRPCKLANVRKGGLARQQAVSRPDHGMSPSETRAFLDRVVRQEVAPPWIRHPQAWDNVVRREAQRA